MKRIYTILEEKSVILYLQKRNLLKQYKVAKEKVLSWFVNKSDFKERKPTWLGIYSFRINKQFRALCYQREPDLYVVVRIDNHQ